MVSNNPDRIDFVGTPPFLRFALQVAMSTMYFHKVQTCVSFRNIFVFRGPKAVFCFFYLCNTDLEQWFGVMCSADISPSVLSLLFCVCSELHIEVLVLSISSQLMFYFKVLTLFNV